MFWEQTKPTWQEGGEEGGRSSRGGRGPYHSAPFLQAGRLGTTFSGSNRNPSKGVGREMTASALPHPLL